MMAERRAQLIIRALQRAAEGTDVARQLARLPAALVLAVDNSRLELTSQGPRVSMNAPLPLWESCLAASPPPGCQSVGALMRTRPDFRIDGDPLSVAQCLAVLEAIVDSARGELAAAGPAGHIDSAGRTDSAARTARAGGIPHPDPGPLPAAEPVRPGPPLDP